MHMAWPKPGEKSQKKWRTLLKNTQCFACNTASTQRQWTWLGPQNTAPCDLQVAVGWLLALWLIYVCGIQFGRMDELFGWGYLSDTNSSLS